MVTDGEKDGLRVGGEDVGCETTRGEIKLIFILELQTLTGNRGPISPSMERVRALGSGMVRAKRGLRLPEGFARRR